MSSSTSLLELRELKSLVLYVPKEEKKKGHDVGYLIFSSDYILCTGKIEAPHAARDGHRSLRGCQGPMKARATRTEGAHSVRVGRGEAQPRSLECGVRSADRLYRAPQGKGAQSG